LTGRKAGDGIVTLGGEAGRVGLDLRNGRNGEKSEEGEKVEG